MWIRIKDTTFNIHNVNVQLSFADHANIHLEIDIHKNPTYYDYFISLYEKREKFAMSNNKFVANGCIIKTMDILFKERMNLDIVSDNINTDIEQRRDLTIKEILLDDNQSVKIIQ